MSRSTLRVLTLSTLSCIAAIPALVGASRAGAEVTRRIYLSATDAKGAPVTDLKAADVTVKEGGKDRPVASLEPATAPMQVAIVVDDAGTGAFQGVVAQFLQKCLGHGQFAISLLSPPVKVVDFTDDVEALKGALARLGNRGRMQADADQLPSAIVDATRALQQRKAERPVILLLTVGGTLSQTVDPSFALTPLRQSGAALNVVLGTTGDLGQVLGDGPKQSGGRTEEAITAPALAAAVAKIADMLQHQYLLTYTLPDGVKMSDKLAVTTSRKGIDLLAPSRIPDK